MSLSLIPSTTIGSIPANDEDFRTGIISMSSLHSPAIEAAPHNKKDSNRFRKTQKQKRAIEKIEKRISSKLAKKSLGGMSDSQDKWFWIFSISWGLGILITLISGATIVATGIGILWFLSFAFGAVALIIWLLKRFR